MDLTGDLYNYYCVLLASRGEQTWEEEFRVGGRGESSTKHDNLQVSQFQEAGWPDTLGKHRRAAETGVKQCRAVQEEDESSLITKDSNCPPQPCTPTSELNSNYGENTVHCHPILSC